MRLFGQPPAIGRVPTIGDGEPPPPDVQEQVVSNQVRNAEQWRDTAGDLVLNNIINERESERETRWEVLAVALLAILILILGSWWTYNNYLHDRFVGAQAQAAQQTPYTPETLH